MIGFIAGNKYLKKAVIMIIDIVALFAAYFFADLMVNKGISAFVSARSFFWWSMSAVMMTIVFVALNMDGIVYSLYGFGDAVKCTLAMAVFSIFDIVFTLIYPHGDISVCIITIMLFAVFIFPAKAYKRILRFIKYRMSSSRTENRIIIVGAGAAGSALLREIRNTDKINSTSVACFLDDNPHKKGHTVGGIKVFGPVDSVFEAVEKYKANRIIVAIPTAPKKVLSQIFKTCQMTGVKVQTVPGMYQLLNEQLSVSNVRDVSIQDLLGRDQVTVNLREIMGYIEGKTVLVTGVGSIGSELCRQIASHNPKRLIMLDIYENNAYDIQMELGRIHPELDLVTLIASIRDKKKLDDVFDKYRPEIIFNAAAHKHVPLMETSPNEAVKNNVFGTLNMARCADKYGAQRFVQISTDKAVNPTNVMGATKRICEMIVQTIGRHSKTEFVAVRFGNVLGSNGSVIPLFNKQIDEGGPVTLTHKDIIRYFMTIPEAVSLVLQAGAYAKGGEIYVLDMGEPMKIYDLACNLIRQRGYEPNVDIEIKCIGLRPGETLDEERLMAEEGLERTDNAMISIGKPLDIDEDNLFSMLDKLYDAAYAETDGMKQLVHELVPTYVIDER